MPTLQMPAPAPRNRAALACIVGLHLFAGLLWMQEKRVRLPAPPAVVSILLRTLAPPAAPPAQRRTVPEVPLSAAARPAVPALPPIVQPAPAAAEPAAEPKAGTAPDPFAATPPDASGRSLDGDLLKRRTGRVTRAIAKELPPLPAEPDNKWTRFGRDLAAAAVNRGAGVREDSYTSPEGVTFYRKRVGDRAMCRMSGSVGVLNMQLVHDQGEAQWVPCPKGAQWKSGP